MPSGGMASDASTGEAVLGDNEVLLMGAGQLVLPDCGADGPEQIAACKTTFDNCLDG